MGVLLAHSSPPPPHQLLQTHLHEFQTRIPTGPLLIVLSHPDPLPRGLPTPPQSAQRQPRGSPAAPSLPPPLARLLAGPALSALPCWLLLGGTHPQGSLPQKRGNRGPENGRSLSQGVGDNSALVFSQLVWYVHIHVQRRAGCSGCVALLGVARMGGGMWAVGVTASVSKCF